jgi:hypothetical protein
VLIIDGDKRKPEYSSGSRDCRTRVKEEEALVKHLLEFINFSDRL